jgi:hypothetical protein
VANYDELNRYIAPVPGFIPKDLIRSPSSSPPLDHAALVAVLDAPGSRHSSGWRATTTRPQGPRIRSGHEPPAARLDPIVAESRE